VPHRERPEGLANLLEDEAVLRAENFTYERGASYDGTVTRRPGSGSLKLTDPSGTFGALTRTVNIAGKPAGFYIVRFFAKTSVVPCRFGTQLKLADSRSSRRENEGITSHAGCSRANEWQEVVQLVYLNPEVYDELRIEVYKRDLPGIVWIDDISIVQAPEPARPFWTQPPSIKRPFDGDRVRLDRLGNWRVEDEPFFPWAIHAGSWRRGEFGPIAEMGWNANIWSSTNNKVQQFKELGMFSFFKLADYIMPGANHNNLDLLRSRLEAVKAAGNLGHVIGYYHDNEKAFGEGPVPLAVFDLVREIDGGAPIYQLNGNEHVARWYSEPGGIDVTGTYYGAGVDEIGGAFNSSGRRKTFEGEVLDGMPGQRVPASMVNISSLREHAGEMRLAVYNNVFAWGGKRGVAYYADGISPEPPIDQVPWYTDFRDHLRDEIDQLMPLIQRPHWTLWSATPNVPTVRIGTREMDDGRRFIIAVNQMTTRQRAEVNLDTLTADGGRVEDYLGGGTVSRIIGNKFSLDLPGIGTGAGTQVLELLT
jgi:hypothetical protein